MPKRSSSLPQEAVSADESASDSVNGNGTENGSGNTSAGSNGAAGAGSKKTNKRQKITLSCAECRRRKIKCDHGKPVCQNCIKKGLEDQCSYSTSPWIDIIANENQIYEEIEYLKRENDLLMKNIQLLKDQTSAIKIEKPSKDEHKQLTDILLKDKIKKIRDLDLELIELPKKYTSPLTPMLTLKVNNDNKYKTIYLEQLLMKFLPSFDTIEFHLNFFFTTNYFLNFKVVSQKQIFNDFYRIFNKQTNKIEIDPACEIQDYLKLAGILAILKITSVYKSTPFKDPENKLLLYIDAALGFGAVVTRSSVAALQAVILLNSYKLFVNDMNDIDLYFLNQLSQDFAIAIGLHKNVDILYSDKSEEERQILKTMWFCLNK